MSFLARSSLQQTLILFIASIPRLSSTHWWYNHIGVQDPTLTEIYMYPQHHFQTDLILLRDRIQDNNNNMQTEHKTYHKSRSQYGPGKIIACFSSVQTWK